MSVRRVPVAVQPPALTRTVDELQSAEVALARIEALGKEAYSRRPDVVVERYGLCFPWEPSAQPNGGVVVLWVGRWPRAVATLIRDASNFTVMSMVEYPERPALQTGGE